MQPQIRRFHYHTTPGVRHLVETAEILKVSEPDVFRLAYRFYYDRELNETLLDELFAGVDPISVLDIQRIIAQLTARSIGVLVTDHNVRETLGICERAYILNEGAVIASGTPDEILANQQVRDVYLGEGFRL